MILGMGDVIVPGLLVGYAFGADRLLELPCHIYGWTMTAGKHSNSNRHCIDYAYNYSLLSRHDHHIRSALRHADSTAGTHLSCAVHTCAFLHAGHCAW